MLVIIIAVIVTTFTGSRDTAMCKIHLHSKSERKQATCSFISHSCLQLFTFDHNPLLTPWKSQLLQTSFGSLNLSGMGWQGVCTNSEFGKQSSVPANQLQWLKDCSVSWKGHHCQPAHPAHSRLYLEVGFHWTGAGRCLITTSLVVT